MPPLKIYKTAKVEPPHPKMGLFPISLKALSHISNLGMSSILLKLKVVIFSISATGIKGN